MEALTQPLKPVTEEEEDVAPKPQPQHTYDGLDYWEPFNNDRKAHILANYTRKLTLWKWVLFALIGFIVALVSIAMKQSIERVSTFRFTTVHHVLESRNSTESAEGDPRYFQAWSFWVSTSLLLIGLSSACIVYVEPKAAGSGLPEVIAYLNGVQLSSVFSFRVMGIKFLSCFMAVSSGLPVGPEGPMIHLGSMVGAFLTQKKHWVLSDTVLKQFRNPVDRRAFITCGAAAGVAAAFGAPVGGLLFVMEEIASFWERPLTWLVFFSTMTTFFTVACFNSVLEGWVPTGHPLGELVENAEVMFEPHIVLSTVNLNVLVILPSMFIGGICGIAAVIFTRLNLFVVRWRRRLVAPVKWRRVAEPLFGALLYTTICFLLSSASSCREMPTSTSFHGVVVDVDRENFAQFACTDGETYSPLATLMLNSGEHSVRHLFSKGTHGQFNPKELLIYLAVYYIFAACSSGSTFATGIVIPMLVIGSVIGRLCGEVFHDIAPSSWMDYTWSDPGLFALIGSAGFFAGVSRLTISLLIIMLEITHEIKFLPPIMVGIMVAKWTADYKQPVSLYHSLIHALGVPFLESGKERQLSHELYTAGDVMNAPVVSLQEVECIGKLFAVLETGHNGFPVVSKGGHLKGIILRVQIESVLENIDLELIRSVSDPCVYVADHFELVRSIQTAEATSTNGVQGWRDTLMQKGASLNEKEKYSRIKLTPFMNNSPFTAHKGFRLNLLRTNFQVMSMRHLVVVDSQFKPVGMITRKDLVKMDHFIETKHEEKAEDVENPIAPGSPWVWSPRTMHSLRETTVEVTWGEDGCSFRREVPILAESDCEELQAEEEEEEEELEVYTVNTRRNGNPLAQPVYYTLAT
eukprot:TRINITY_DN1357_c0_g2_i3.p1 TRINITY_DN1357_c0_g2~~TRINITY_DN1357_c0_g2_i3.p1  ORF type:complete len:860 (+),score=262.60 TRINITY_DN1357_c0_g2_i3:31-2610(+)